MTLEKPFITGVMPVSKTVFVTGASGFIGQYVIREFANAGWHVRAAARTLFDPMIRGVEVIEINDICAVDSWAAAIGESQVVVHLAARAHVSSQDNEENLFRRVNVDATVNLATGAAAAGVKRFVFISSAGVMGEATDRPKREIDKPDPASQYARSKLEAEIELAGLRKTSAMELVILRPTLVYGGGNPGNLARLIGLIQTGLPLPFGAARNKRSLLGVEHLAQIIRKAADLPNLDGEVFLVADGNDLTTAEIVRCLAEGCGRKTRLMRVPLPALRMAAALAGRTKDFDKLFGPLQIDATKKRSVFGDISRDETIKGLIAAGRS